MVTKKDIDYDKLLDEWAEKTYAEADKGWDVWLEEDEGSMRGMYSKGYSDGIRMAMAILFRMESKELCKLKYEKEKLIFKIYDSNDGTWKAYHRLVPD